MTIRFHADEYFELLVPELIKKNQKKFKDVTLAKHFKGKTLKNKFGACYKITSKIKFETIRPNHTDIKQKLLSDLKAIPGISHITESKLKQEGVNSIADLIKHYRFGNNASRYFDFVENKNALKIYEQLSSRFTSSNPLLLHNSALFDLNKIVLIDIETLGLTECPLFLIGIATFQNSELIVDQIFVRKLTEEKAALHAFAEILQDKDAIGTFNGKSFDVPFIRKRMERHDLNHEINHPHFDFFYFSKKAFKDNLYDFRLTTIEKEIFLEKRKEDVSGSEIPFYYTTYTKTNNIGSVVPIIDHNKKDLITTAKLFMKLHDIWS